MEYKRCLDRRAAARQRQVEDCLLKNMAETPFDSISVIDLCQQTGISRTAFYRYFSRKEACLWALLDSTTMDFCLFDLDYKDPIETTDQTGFYQQTYKYVLYWTQQKALLDALVRNKLDHVLVDRISRLVINEVPSVLQWLGAEDTEHANYALVFLFSGIIALILDWHTSGYPLTVAQMAQTLTHLLRTPLAVPPCVLPSTPAE